MTVQVEMRESYFVRPADVVGANIGVNRKMFYKAVKSGALRGVVLPGSTYKVYRRDEVLRVFGVQQEQRT